MKLVAQGASRQEGHEHIRILSNEAGSMVKNEVCRAGSWLLHNHPNSHDL